MKMVDGKPVVHAEVLRYIWKMAQQWDTPINVGESESTCKGGAICGVEPDG